MARIHLNYYARPGAWHNNFGSFNSFWYLNQFSIPTFLNEFIPAVLIMNYISILQRLGNVYHQGLTRKGFRNR